MNMVRKIGEFMNKKKLFIIMFCVILMVFVFTGSVAYYRYTLEGKIIASTGNAVFNVTGINNETKIIDLGNTLLPGDRGSFTVTLDSTGSTVDMYATLKIDRKVLPDNLKFYSTSDYKSEIKTYYSFLEVSGTKSETLTIYWYWNPFKDDEDDNKYIGKSLSADISVSAVQISEYAMMKNGYSAKSEFWNNTYKKYIRTITFGNDLSNLPSSCTEENLCWDISGSSTQNKKVYGYLIDSGLTVSETDSSTSTTTEKTLYNLYIVSDAPIFAPSSCTGMFREFKNLVQINFNNNFNTSKVTNMSWMFFNCTSLTSLDLSNFNTSNVTNMSDMFYKCSSLTTLDLSSFNTSNVTNMWQMFASCSSLTSLNLGNFNTSKITDMSDMFNSCSSLTNLDLSHFNTSKVTDMSNMFRNCSSLISLDLSGFNTSKVTDMRYMFCGCSSLTNLDLSGFNTSNVTNMMNMFGGCSSLTNLDLSNLNTSKVTNMNNMFSDCSKLTTTINIMNANVTNYEYMFYNAATDPNAKITVNYIAAASTLVDNMIATKSYNSNVVKGIQI
ncbi:pF03382 family protein [Firmicutes bacterium CAG:884]|nr:pF03382 family protein [Firmicutes bacterium CAG:884]